MRREASTMIPSSLVQMRRLPWVDRRSAAKMAAAIRVIGLGRCGSDIAFLCPDVASFAGWQQTFPGLEINTRRQFDRRPHLAGTRKTLARPEGFEPPTPRSVVW